MEVGGLGLMKLAKMGEIGSLNRITPLHRSLHLCFTLELLVESFVALTGGIGSIRKLDFRPPLNEPDFDHYFLLLHVHQKRSKVVFVVLFIFLKNQN